MRRSISPSDIVVTIFVFIKYEARHSLGKYTKCVHTYRFNRFNLEKELNNLKTETHLKTKSANSRACACAYALTRYMHI